MNIEDRLYTGTSKYQQRFFFLLFIVVHVFGMIHDTRYTTYINHRFAFTLDLYLLLFFQGVHETSARSSDRAAKPRNIMIVVVIVFICLFCSFFFFF